MTDLLTQKNNKRANFQPKKVHQPLPSCILQVPPPNWDVVLFIMVIELSGVQFGLKSYT